MGMREEKRNDRESERETEGKIGGDILSREIKSLQGLISLVQSDLDGQNALFSLDTISKKLSMESIIFEFGSR